MAEHVSMRLEWDEVDDRPITAVLGLEAMTMNDGTARWDAVAICLENRALLVTVEIDTDQVIIDLDDLPASEGWTSISSLDYAVGETLGWCWVGINSQEYKDTFTVALNSGDIDALDPKFTFVAAASSIACFDLVPHHA